MIITIDGPAGSGKSTAARKLAARLEIAYLDTGAMYRAIAYAAQQRGLDFADASALLDIARSTRLELDCGPTHTRVRVDGHDVSEVIRSMSVSAATPYVARHAEIRELLVARQREIGQELVSFVSEGRDQGSVVFPNADVRFVLEASLDRRAERRRQELVVDGEDVEFEEVMENLRSRDAVDAQQWTPLLELTDPVVLDTTDLTILQVVECMLETISERANGPKKPA